MSRNLTLCVFIASAFVAGAIRTSYLCADEQQDALVKLLEVGWGKTPPIRVAGDLQADELFEIAGRQPVPLYAYSLVLMKQGRYADAGKVLDEILKKETKNLEAWRAKAWLTAVLKNYGGSMAAAEKLSLLIPKTEAASNEEEDRQREFIAFLGRLYGFLGGPAQASLSVDERKASEKKISERLTEDRRVVFEEARDGVLQRYLELTGAKQDEKEKAKEKADADREKTLREIAEQRGESKDRIKELEEQVDKAKKEHQDESAAIAKSDGPLVAELTRLNARATVFNRELLAIDGQITRLQIQLNQERDPNLRNILQFQISDLQVLFTRYEADLFALNRQADTVQAQRIGLANRQQRADNDLAGKLNRVDGELAALNKQEKRNTAIEKRASKSTAATPTSALSLSAQAAALGTYDPYPLEQEKLRILEGLK